MENICIPSDGFRSFNDFFTRKRKKGALSFDMTPKHLCSPCDGFLSCVQIRRDSVFAIKHTKYSLQGLLESKTLAREFAGGTALIFRLTPQHYHRYSFVDSGRCVSVKKINGVLHCVRPIATEQIPVYVRNSREYIVFDSDSFGRLIQMEIGALLVGKIRNNAIKGIVKRGSEKGCFEFGGSTIILLFKANAVSLNAEIIKRLKSHDETEVRAGEWIGVKSE